MKNTLKAITLIAVLMMGTTFATAGILVSDRAEKGGCTSKTGIIVSDAPGIIVSDRAYVNAILTAIVGIIVSDRSQKSTCIEKNEGIIVSDRGGIIVSDRGGILVSD